MSAIEARGLVKVFQTARRATGLLGTLRSLIIGAVFGQRTQLWWDLPARESFRILRDIYDVGRAEYETRLRKFDSLLELSSFWDTRTRHLSLGQRVRCDLAAALLHDPPVVFLDEPTIGMDAVVKEQVRALPPGRARSSARCH